MEALRSFIVLGEIMAFYRGGRVVTLILLRFSIIENHGKCTKNYYCLYIIKVHFDVCFLTFSFVMYIQGSQFEI